MLGNLKPSERKRRALYRRVFKDSPDGEAVIEDLCKRYFMNRSTADSGDPNIVFFNEGQRVLVLEIKKAAGLLPENTPIEVSENDRNTEL